MIRVIFLTQTLATPPKLLRRFVQNIIIVLWFWEVQRQHSQPIIVQNLAKSNCLNFLFASTEKNSQKFKLLICSVRCVTAAIWCFLHRWLLLLTSASQTRSRQCYSSTDEDIRLLWCAKNADMLQNALIVMFRSFITKRTKHSNAIIVAKDTKLWLVVLSAKAHT